MATASTSGVTDRPIAQLAPFVGAFSQRAAQIERNIQRYEAEWSAAHPEETVGPALRRAWDARAWADGRPDKLIPHFGAELHARWLSELADLGYRDRDKPIELTPTPVGAVDRERAVELVLARLAAGKSAWNGPDIRGEVEQHIASAGVIVDAQVRAELAEDLTARALQRCVPLLHRDGVPEHIRALTSTHVLDVEADIAGRLAVRGAEPGRDIDPSRVARVAEMTCRELDAAQSTVVAALAGDRALIVVEGAAGAEKTTTLAAARDLLAGQRSPPECGHADVESGEGRPDRDRRPCPVRGTARAPARLAVGQRRQVDQARAGRP